MRNNGSSYQKEKGGDERRERGCFVWRPAARRALLSAHAPLSDGCPPFATDSVGQMRAGDSTTPVGLKATQAIGCVNRLGNSEAASMAWAPALMKPAVPNCLVLPGH